MIPFRANCTVFHTAARWIRVVARIRPPSSTILAEAAAVEGQFWAMHDWLYENQDGWVANGGAGLEAGVQALGLDKAAIAAALRSPDIDTHIRRDFMGGVRSGVNGTPSFYVNGELHQGDFDSLTHGVGRLIARQA